MPKHPMIDALADQRIFDVVRRGPGLVFTEACDNYFCLVLNPDEVRQLCDELLSLLEDSE